MFSSLHESTVIVPIKLFGPNIPIIFFVFVWSYIVNSNESIELINIITTEQITLQLILALLAS